MLKIFLNYNNTNKIVNLKAKNNFKMIKQQEATLATNLCFSNYDKNRIKIIGKHHTF
jgi:hypothetical protein